MLPVPKGNSGQLRLSTAGKIPAFFASNKFGWLFKNFETIYSHKIASQT